MVNDATVDPKKLSQLSCNCNIQFGCFLFYFYLLELSFVLKTFIYENTNKRIEVIPTFELEKLKKLNTIRKKKHFENKKQKLTVSISFLLAIQHN